MKKRLLMLAILFICASSCSTVREYEKININDPDMALTNKKIDRFEINFQTYRESSSGANGGKTGGGCGCN